MRGELRQHFRDLHKANEIGREGGARLLCFCVENVQAQRAGIEVDVVGYVMHSRLAVAVVEAEAARDKIEQSAGQSFGNLRHAISHGDARAAQQVDDIRSDANAWIFDELEGFFDDAFDQRLVEQLELWPHACFSR